MSTDHPTLAEIADAHFAVNIDGCGCSGITESTGQHIADMWHYACTITTVEQLDALPDGAAILVGDRSVMQRGKSGWYSPGWDTSRDSADIAEWVSRIVLLWHPAWTKP